MQSLVLLILASVWAAVFIPPLLRSRIENRTSESVSDFRRQLNKLQSAVPNRSGHVSMARPLAQSPMHRQSAAGRGGQSPNGRRQHASPRGDRSSQARGAQLRRQATTVGERQAPSRYGRSHAADQRGPAPQQRLNPARGGRPDPGRTPPRGRRRPTQGGPAYARAGDGRPVREHAHRQTQVHRDASSGEALRRRRSNVLVALMMLTGGTLFVATQSRSTPMLFIFALSFIALCGYLWILSQAKQREERGGWGSDWMS